MNGRQGDVVRDGSAPGARDGGRRAPALAPVAEWGRRLSDAVRERLRTGDLDAARALVVTGDGQTRSLAGEYAYLVRGLGITVRVLMGLMPAEIARMPAPAAAAAADDANAIIRAFGGDLARMAGVEAAGIPAGGQDRIEAAIEAATAAVDAMQAWFEREQAQLAAQALAAIDAGDRERALACVDRKETGQYLPLHDRLTLFMAQCFGWALRHAGEDGLLRYHLGAAQGQRRGFDKWETLPPAELAWTIAFLLKQHMGQVSVREDDEKYVLVQSPCGSGGRLRTSGAYEGPDALPVVRSRGPLAFGGPEAPVYCSHCPVWNASAPLRWYGRPHWVYEDPARPDGGCTVLVYKRPADVPADFVRRVRLAD